MRYEVRVNAKVDGIEGNRKYIKEAESHSLLNKK